MGAVEQDLFERRFFEPREQVEWVELVVRLQSVLFGKAVWCTIGPTTLCKWYDSAQRSALQIIQNKCSVACANRAGKSSLEIS